MQIEYVQSCSVTILAYVRNGYFFFLWVLDNPRGQYKQNIIPPEVCIYIDYLKKDSGSLVFSKFYKTQITRFNELGYVVRLADTMVYGGGALAPSRHLGGWNSGK